MYQRPQSSSRLLPPVGALEGLQGYDNDQADDDQRDPVVVGRGRGNISLPCQRPRPRFIGSPHLLLESVCSARFWLPPGMETTDGYLRVTAVVAPENDETFRAYLVVEPFDMPE